MIPLIDVSLVLLVFFMLSASTAVMAGMVNTPEANHALQADNAEGLHIDIPLDEDKIPVFALRVGNRPAEPDEKDLRSMAAVLDRLKARLLKTTGPVDLQINGDKKLASKVTRDLSVGLLAEPFRGRVVGPSYGVTGRQE